MNKPGSPEHLEPLLLPYSQDSSEAVLKQVDEVVHRQLEPLVERIDQGFYPKEIMHSLGAAGAYGLHLKPAPDFAAAIAAMTHVSQVCMSTGFMVWCHDVCGLYIEQSGNATLIANRLENHASGLRLGGTAMSNPMKTFAGIETMLLKGRRSAGGYMVNGALPWVSNMGSGHYMGAVFSVEGTDNHEVMFILDCDAPGVTLKQCPAFSGMEGTHTFSIRLTDVFISDDVLVADPVRPFVQRIKGAFILLQTGMGLGVVQGAIDSMWQVEQQLGHVNQFLEDRPDELQNELDDLQARINLLAVSPYDGSRDHLLGVLDARAHCSELSLRASQSALLHQGARGYLMSAAPQRRIREAHFVAIVTPALKHLRKEMARLSEMEQPA